MNLRIAVLVLMVFTLSQPLKGQYIEDFENTEDLLQKSFWKQYFSSLWEGFTDIGDPFTSSGGIGLSMRSYSATGVEDRQDPFFYSLNANLNIRLYKINFPFTLLVSARQTESSLPNIQEIIDAFKDNVESVKNRFIRVGASPYYKWIRLHLGHRTMNFSQYTLADLNFYGVGADLTPGKWRLSLMRGRLAKAEPIDLSLAFPNEPVYQRTGWGVKLGYGDEDMSADMILFTAADDPNSITIPEDYWDQPTAEENMVFGLNAQKLFFERFRLAGEWALSAYSPNAEDEVGDAKFFPSFLYKTRTTTERNSALDATLDYEGNAFTVGVQYTRVDPGFNSLGAFFFNRDIENFVGNLDFTLFDGAVFSLLSFGVQKDNLKNENETTATQTIYSGEISYAGSAFSIGTNFSNDEFKLQYVLNRDLDSLNAVVVTSDYGLNSSYSLIDSSGNQHVFAATFNLQEVTDNIDDPFATAASKMFLGNFTYNLILSSQWAFNTQLNFNQNELAGMVLKRYGGGLGVGRSFLDGKINLNINMDYFLNTSEFDEDNSSLNSQLNMNYAVSQSLNINFATSYLQTKDPFGDFSELTSTMGIQYNFGWQPNWGRRPSRRLSREEMQEMREQKRQRKMERRAEKLAEKQRKAEEKAQKKAEKEAQKLEEERLKQLEKEQELLQEDESGSIPEEGQEPQQEEGQEEGGQLNSIQTEPK